MLLCFNFLKVGREEFERAREILGSPETQAESVQSMYELSDLRIQDPNAESMYPWFRGCAQIILE